MRLLRQRNLQEREDTLHSCYPCSISIYTQNRYCRRTEDQKKTPMASATASEPNTARLFKQVVFALVTSHWQDQTLNSVLFSRAQNDPRKAANVLQVSTWPARSRAQYISSKGGPLYHWSVFFKQSLRIQQNLALRPPPKYT